MNPIDAWAIANPEIAAAALLAAVFLPLFIIFYRKDKNDV